MAEAPEAKAAGTDSQAPAAPKKKVVKKKKKKKGAILVFLHGDAEKGVDPLAIRMKKRIDGTKEFFGVLGSTFRSQDRELKRMGYLFVLAILGIASLFTALGVYRYKLSNPEDQVAQQGENISKFLQKQAEDSKNKFLTANLGSFTVSLKKDESLPGSNKVSNMAEFEVAVECDTVETCNMVIEKTTEARDKLVRAIESVEREEMLSQDGKARIRAGLKDKLNDWLGEGKITNLYFPRLVVD